MSRWKASALHFCISVAIVASIAGLVLTFWYPLSLVRLGGIPGLIGLIAVVDVVVGPVLTLIVFKAGKPGLKFDLSVIALLQAGLLAYGLYALSANRPIFLVAVKDRFELVTAREIADEDLAQGKAPYNDRSWTGAQIVGVRFPTDGDEQLRLIESATRGRDIQHQPRYFAPFAESQREIVAAASSLGDLLPNCTPSEIDRLRRAAGDRDLARLRYVPITNAKRDVALMLLEPESGATIASVDIDPWAIEKRASAAPTTSSSGAARD